MKGYKSQLPTYVRAEEASQAHYLVIDVGNLGEKWSNLQSLYNEKVAAGEKAHPIWLVDATERASASKRRLSS